MALAVNESPYSETQPFVRNRVDKNGYTSQVPSTVDRENALLQQKLEDIKCRPQTALCRAPLQHCGHLKHFQCNSEPWESFKVHSHIQPSCGKSPKKQRDRDIQLDNRVLQRRLQECYAIRKDSFVVANHLGPGVDCNQQWSQRTGLYATQSSSGRVDGAARTTSAPAAARCKAACNTAAPRSYCGTGVPKTLGVASCAGCGQRSYFQADGMALKPCAACKQVYYCSKTCARIDQPSHKALCRFYTTGQWTPAGIRPTADCWVMNTSMAAARKLLRQQQQQKNSSSSSSCSPLVGPTSSDTADTAAAALAGAVSSSQEFACGSMATRSCATAELNQNPEPCHADVAVDCRQKRTHDPARYEVTCPGELVYCRQPRTAANLPCRNSAADTAQQIVRRQHTATRTIPLQQAQEQLMQLRFANNSQWDIELDREQQILQQIAAVRLQELNDDSRLAAVEWQANYGLVGPRPCCYGVDGQHDSERKHSSQARHGVKGTLL